MTPRGCRSAILTLGVGVLLWLAAALAVYRWWLG
jgi:hypothetical protein